MPGRGNSPRDITILSVNFLLRDFQPEDFETLWSMDQVCFAPGIAYSRQELNHYIRQRWSFTLVADAIPAPNQPRQNTPRTPASSSILGFLVAETRRDTGHLITIDVLPSFRRSGVGSKLLIAAEGRLLGLSCRRVYLETAVNNLSAIAFYKRHGYFDVKTIPGYYSNGIDAHILEKDLLSVRRAS